MSDELKSIGMFDLTKAEMIKEILSEEEIEVFMKGTTIPYADPVIFGQGGMVEIMVKEEDYEKAMKLIENFEMGDEGHEEDTTT